MEKIYSWLGFLIFWIGGGYIVWQMFRTFFWQAFYMTVISMIGGYWNCSYKKDKWFYQIFWYHFKEYLIGVSGYCTKINAGYADLYPQQLWKCRPKFRKNIE